MTPSNCFQEVILDPTKSFKAAEPRHLCEALGVLPYWVNDWISASSEAADGGSSYDQDLKAFMEQAYGFPLVEIEGGTVAEDGVYQSKYEDDSPMPPIALIQTPAGKYFQYDYGIVAIPTSDGHFVTRMD